MGTGIPKVRFKFYQDFSEIGGILFSVKGTGLVYSNFAINNDADIFNLCFIGAKTEIGKGSLINTGAQIHHEVKIGKFSEINPGAILLGKVEVGDFCSIGANATILPKVKIGNYVTVGAGSVVTHNVPDGVTVLGVLWAIDLSFDVMKIKKYLFSLITKSKGTVLGDFLKSASKSIIDALENKDNNHFTNGEFWLISVLKDTDVKTVFDVGANVGVWTNQFKLMHP